MTGEELTKAVREIWKRACTETAALVKAQKYKVFDSEYSFHKYIKHGRKDGIVKDGSELLTLFMEDKVSNKDSFVIGTPENIEAERRKCLKEKIDWCRSQLDYGRDCIIKNEAELRELLKEKKREDDRQRKAKSVHGVHRKNRKSPGLRI
jgi:hypothetical protein